jgi:hypothetical protein
MLWRWFLARRIVRPWIRRRYFPPKPVLTSNGQHNVISQETILFITTVQITTVTFVSENQQITSTQNQIYYIFSARHTKLKVYIQVKMNHTNILQIEIRASRSFIFLCSKNLRNYTNPLKAEIICFMWWERRACLGHLVLCLHSHLTSPPPPLSHIPVNADIPYFHMKNVFRGKTTP